MVSTDKPISLDNTEKQEPISLEVGTPSYMLSPELVKSKAFNTAYALSGTPAERDYNSLETDISLGNEHKIREETAELLNADLTKKRHDIMSKALAAKQGPLTADDLKAVDLATGYNFPYTYPVDPNSVFEQAYGNKYISELDGFASTLDDTHPWNVASTAMPNDLNLYKKFGSVTIAQNQYLLTKAQDLQNRVNNQSWFGFGADWMKTFFPVYNELKLRNQIPETGFLKGGLLGDNLEEQRLNLLRMPLKQFTETVDKIVEDLGQDNPQLGLLFLMAMLGQSSSEKSLNNINTILTPTDAGLALGIGKTVFKAGSVHFQIRNAVKSAINNKNLGAAATPEEEAANIAASVGDLGTSAVRQSTSNIVNDFVGNVDPVKRAIDDLPSYMKEMISEIKASDLSNTRKNILEEQTATSFARLMKGLGEVFAPNRVQVEALTKAQLEEVSKLVPQRYGVQNDLIDISSPAYNPYSRAYDVTMKVGKDAGILFGTEEEALHAAKFRGFKIDYTPEQKANLEARIQALKDDLKEPPAMDADTAGLNIYYAKEAQLESLQKELKDITPGGYKVKGTGLGYYYEVTGSLDETDPLIRNLLVTPERPESVSPDSWTKQIPYLNHLRTAEDTLSVEQRANRKLSNYPQAVMFQIALEDGKYISDLMRGLKRVDDVTGEAIPAYRRYVPGLSGLIHKKHWKRFNETLDYSQTAHNPAIPDSKEGYYMTPRQLDQYYIEKYGERPSFPEIQAYEAVKRWSEMDLIIRKTSEHRNMARLGAETQQIILKNKAGEEIKSNPFVGSREDKLPNSRQTIAIIPENADDAKLISNEKISQSQRKIWNEEIAKGQWKVIKIYRPRSYPLKGLIKDGDTFISYAIVKNAETSPLTWDLIPRLGGGHSVYDYPMYIKQPEVVLEEISSVRKANYLGDKTLIPVSHSPMGKDLVNKLNQVRTLLKDGSSSEAKTAYKNLGLEGAFGPWKDFRGKFYRTKNPDGTYNRPAFNLNEDFELVPKNKSTVDLSKKLEKKYGDDAMGPWKGSWRDATREGSPADNFQVEFTGERDAEGLRSVENIGSQRNPIYRQVPAKKVDPLTTLNRGMRRIIHSSFMDDYKTAGIEAWVQEAKEYMKDPVSFIERSPYFYFRTATRDSFKSGTPQEIVNKLMANHFKINQFVGTPTALDSFVYSTSQKIADTAYEHLGPKASSYITPTWLIPKLRDPFSWMRSVTFNAYLGLGAVPQMLVQTMSYVNMYAITPRYAATGTMGAYLHMLSKFNRNPEILNTIDDIASKLHIPGLPRYLPGQWKEANELLARSGFLHIGQEYSLLGDMARTHLIRRGKDRFLSMGQSPFRAGEKATRAGAWYIAHKEWRDANPTGRITKADQAKILDRADLLYGNMSNASHSMLNSGIVSVPFQFYNYTTRLSEIFWSGSRLGGTAAQRIAARARLIAFNGMFFGAPLAVGVTGAPLTEWVRQQLLDERYVPGQNFVETLINEGLPAQMLYLASGQRYNVGPRLGLQGFERLNDVMFGADGASIWTILGGAFGSLSANTAPNIEEFVTAMSYLASGRYDEYPIKLDDLVNVFKEVYSVGSGQALWVAMNTGRWIDKHHRTIDKTSWQNALFMFLTGLRTTGQSDIWPKNLVLQKRHELQRETLNKVQEFIYRSIIAQSMGDPEQAQDYYKRAQARLVGTDFPKEKIGIAIANAIKKAGVDKIKATDFKFYFKHVPPSQAEELGEAYRWKLEHEYKFDGE